MDIRKITSLIFLGLITCNAENLAGKVISINDGDTLSVLTKDNTQYKIRLNHIDAPESKQSFGSKSKQNLSNYVFGKNIIVDYKNKDRYGRILGTIIYQGNNINLMQVKDCLRRNDSYSQPELIRTASRKVFVHSAGGISYKNGT